MNRTKLTWTMANIEKMHKDKNVISFDHPIQRKSEMWTNQQKSLLLHSMLANYPIPNIYVLREDSEQVDVKGKPVFNYFVMDGKQRLTSVLSYIWGEFPLDEDIPNITVEDTEYVIAGKYFCDLDEPVQFEIKRYKFEIVAFEECSNREIEEIFFRLNNSTVLTKAQIAKCKVGVELAGLVNEILSSKFFTTSCNFSSAQLRASDDQKSLFQAMMLLDSNYVDGFEMKDFSETSIMEYSESIRENYSDKQQDILVSATQFLADAFPEKNKLIRKINVPMIIFLADSAMNMGIKPRFFREWWNYFTEEDALYEDYKLFCSSGSTKQEKIKGRLAVLIKSLCAYHEVDIPEELKCLVEEVTDKIAALKEDQNEEPLTDEADPVDEEKLAEEVTDKIADGNEEQLTDEAQLTDEEHLVDGGETASVDGEGHLVTDDGETAFADGEEQLVKAG